MARRRRWIWALGGVALLGIALAALAWSLLNPERLKAMALAEVRRATGYTIEAGPASLRLGFSGVVLRVGDLRVTTPDSSQVLSVERAEAALKLRPLLRRRIELRHLGLFRPDLRLRLTASAGQAAPRLAGSPAFALFAAESWSIQEGRYAQTAPEGDLALSGLDLTGKLTWRAGDGARGTARGTAQTGSWKAPALTVALPPIEGLVDFHLSAAMDSLALPRVELSSGAMRLTLRGGFHPEGRVWTGALSGRAEPFTWNDVRGFVPPEGLAKLSGLELAGRFELPELHIARVADGKFLVSGRARVDGFSAKAARAPLGLSEAGGELRFSPGLILVEGGEGRLGPDPVRFFARVEGEPPAGVILRAQVATRVAGSSLGGLLPEGASLAVTGGALDLDLALSGTPPFSRKRLPDLDGRVVFEDLTGVWRGLPLLAAGRIRLAGRGASVEGLSARLGKSDIALSGTLEDLAAPDLRFVLTSQTLDLDELLPGETKVAGDSAAAGATAAPPLIAVPGSGTLRIGTLHMRGHRLENLTAGARLGLDGLRLKDLRADAYGGRVAGSLAVLPAAEGTAFTHEGELDLSAVDLGSALAEWLPVGRRLEGKGRATLAWRGRHAPGLDPLRAIDLDGVFGLDDGALLNMPGLAGLAQTLRIDQASAHRWPFQRLTAALSLREGRVLLDSLRVGQPGIGWILSGSVGLDGSLALSGLLRADPKRVSLPPELALFVPYLTESDGRIPIDFTLAGSFADPVVALDWEALGERAAARARGEEGEKLQRKLLDAVKDPGALDRLKKIFGGGKGG